jgi:hypothetical protein
MAYEFQTCPDAKLWNEFVALSPQQSVFASTPFLDALQTDYRLAWVLDGDRPLLGTVLLLDQNGCPRPAPYPYSLYQGALFDQSLLKLLPHRRTQAELELSTFMLEQLAAEYPVISACIHPAVLDLRAFSWFHYHEPEKGQFDLRLFYTGVIDLAGPGSFEDYLAQIRYARRRDYRKGGEAGFRVEPCQDMDVMDSLYRLTFARQDIEVKQDSLDLMLSICRAALEQEFGEMLVCRDPKGEACAAALFIHDRHQAYYLVGANHPDHRNTPAGAYVVLEGIRRCRERGLQAVDVCGINSPGRGDFKIGLNAEPRPYYVANWRRPAAPA